jgi:hypothetical protein
MKDKKDLILNRKKDKEKEQAKANPKEEVKNDAPISQDLDKLMTAVLQKQKDTKMVEAIMNEVISPNKPKKSMSFKDKKSPKKESESEVVTSKSK